MEPPLKTLRTGLLTDDESLQSAIAIAISLFVTHSPTLPLLFSGFGWVFGGWCFRYLTPNLRGAETWMAANGMTHHHQLLSNFNSHSRSHQNFRLILSRWLVYKLLRPKFNRIVISYVADSSSVTSLGLWTVDGNRLPSPRMYRILIWM